MDIDTKVNDIKFGENYISCFGEITPEQRETMLKTNKAGDYKNIDPADQLVIEEKDYKRIISKMDCGTYSNDFVVTLEGKIYILVNIEPPIGSGEKEPRPVFMRFHGKLSEAQNLQYINELMYIRELVQEAKLVNEKRAEDAKAAQPKKPSASKKVITAVIFILLAFFMVFEGLSTRDSGRVVLVMMMWFAYKFVCIDDLTTNKNAKIAFLVQTCGLIVVYLLACVIFNFYGLSTLMGTTVSMA